MFALLGLIPVLPLAGFVLLALSGGKLPKPAIAVVGVGSVGLSALVALGVAVEFNGAGPQTAYVQTLWRWIDVAGFAPAIAFRLDALALVMVLVITVVGFLIHLYSAEHMAREEGYNRYFAYLNLFVAAMCTLVLADNLLLLYLGWEAVGLCSYLLIGFWYRDPANGLAARKAFVVTRAGDVAFTIGLLLLFTHLGTLDIQELMRRAAQQWPAGSPLAIAATLLLLGGAVGKSAQLPLQTWLPDAMAGPSPVSALIHAATMVTAGVYLIARTHVLCTLAPAVQTLVALVGAATLLLAAFSALAQHDIKRVLAYSTISQIGYMFLALGVGAWVAAIFHFMIHAFFKALLFLAAGAVIQSLDDEHDIHRMGGLRTKMPVAFWTFVIGGAALAALPLVTAGFYSKDLILWQAWSSAQGSRWLWAAGWVGSVLTGFYIFRVVFVAFFGVAKTPVRALPGWRVKSPLVVLALLSIVGGFVETPPLLGGVSLLSTFLHGALPSTPSATPEDQEVVLALLAAAASLGGIAAAWLVFLRHPGWAQRVSGSRLGKAVAAFWHGGWGFDTLYDRLFVRPYVATAHADRHDVIDRFYDGIAAICRGAYAALARSQDGRMRRYAGAIAAGAVTVLALTLLPW